MLSVFKKVAGKMVHIVVGPYRLNKIYRLSEAVPEPPLPPGLVLEQLGEQGLEELRNSTDRELRKSAGFAGEGVHGYALRQSGALVAVAFFATRDGFSSDNIWPLPEDEAALVELVTHPDHRGQGLAPLLIKLASNRMFDSGLHRLMTWLWWSNSPSERAFLKSGWHRIAFVIEFEPWWKKGSIIFRRHSKGSYGGTIRKPERAVS